MKGRVSYFDFLRGLAIMMVVGIHTYTLGADSVMVRQLFNAAVPLFIAISGYFLSQKKMACKQDYLSFLGKQLPKVYVPVLAWSLPFYIAGLFAGRNIFQMTVLFLICGMSIYYFVAFIIQCYIVLPAINICISKNKYKWGGVILSCIISIFWVFGVVWLKTNGEIIIPLILYAGPLPCWLMFFVIGVLIGRHKPERDYSIALPIILTLIGFGLSVAESNYLVSHYGIGAGIKPSSYIYSAGMVLLLFSNNLENRFSRTGNFYKLFVWIGRLSFGIYLIHCYFVTLVSHIPVNSWLLKFAFSLFFTIIFIMGVRKILPLRYHRYLGI